MNGVDCACNENGDAGVSYDELSKCLSPVLVFFFGEDFFENGFGQDVFDSFDSNNDGLLDYQEGSLFVDWIEENIPA